MQGRATPAAAASYYAAAAPLAATSPESLLAVIADSPSARFHVQDATLADDDPNGRSRDSTVWITRRFMASKGTALGDAWNLRDLQGPFLGWL